MIKNTLLLCSIFVLLMRFSTSAQMAELPFSEKVKNSSDIFEGKVIRKSCFWNVPHTLIFTSNVIEIYKVFKGSIASAELEIITEGGQVEYDIQNASESLSLNINDVGVFMVELFAVTNPQSNVNKNATYRVYGGAQGFIKYDLKEKNAADLFRKYKNIQNDVYEAINQQTGQSFKIIKTFNIDSTHENSSKKRCCKRSKKKPVK